MNPHMPIPVPSPETLIPFVVIFSTFAFILSVILIGKSPKAGAWLVGGLVLSVPLLLYRAALGGLFNTPVAIPIVIIPSTFLFILTIIVLSKAPRAGAALIAVLIVMGLFATFFATRVSHRLTGVAQQAMPAPPTRPWPVPSAPIAPPSATPAPIWSAGIEKEMDADVYPSQLAAVGAMGWRMDRTIRELVKEVNSPAHLVLFQESRDPGLLAGLKNAIQEVLSDLPCGIEAEMRNIRPNEIGVELHFHDQDMQPAPWARSSETKAQSGRIEVRAFTTHGQASAQTGFVEKPWVDHFATFASTRPQQAFIIARSQGTCTSESEANQQALDDARARLTEAIGNRGGRKLGPAAPPITATDVLKGGFILDRFAQSFAGSAGKIWRQALLLDVSGSKLAQLSGLKVREFRQVKETWAKMGFSVIGVVVLIGVIYFFLNMATMGYYEWSLRIASVVLAVVAVISVLMVVK